MSLNVTRHPSFPSPLFLAQGNQRPPRKNSQRLITTNESHTRHQSIVYRNPNTTSEPQRTPPRTPSASRSREPIGVILILRKGACKTSMEVACYLCADRVHTDGGDSCKFPKPYPNVVRWVGDVVCCSPHLISCLYNQSILLQRRRRSRMRQASVGHAWLARGLCTAQ